LDTKNCVWLANAANCAVKLADSFDDAYPVKSPHPRIAPSTAPFGVRQLFWSTDIIEMPLVE